MRLIIIKVELATEGKWSVTLLKVPYSAYWWRFLELEGMAMVWGRYFAFGDRQHTALLPCLPEWSLSSVLSLSVSVSVFLLSFTFHFCQKCHFAPPPPPPEKKKKRHYIILPNFWLALPLNSSLSRTQSQKIQNHAAHLTFTALVKDIAPFLKKPNWLPVAECTVSVFVKLATIF